MSEHGKGCNCGYDPARHRTVSQLIFYVDDHGRVGLHAESDFETYEELGNTLHPLDLLGIQTLLHDESLRFQEVLLAVAAREITHIFDEVLEAEPEGAEDDDLFN